MNFSPWKGEWPYKKLHLHSSCYTKVESAMLKFLSPTSMQSKQNTKKIGPWNL